TGGLSNPPRRCGHSRPGRRERANDPVSPGFPPAALLQAPAPPPFLAPLPRPPPRTRETGGLVPSALPLAAARFPGPAPPSRMTGERARGVLLRRPPGTVRGLPLNLSRCLSKVSIILAKSNSDRQKRSSL